MFSCCDSVTVALETVSVFFTGSKWPVRDITYRIDRYSDKLHVYEVQKEIQRAFDVSYM